MIRRVMWEASLPVTVLLAVCYIGGDRTAEAAGFFGSRVSLPPEPCLLTADGAINMTSLQALGRARLNAGIRKALTCGNVPRDQLCSHMVDGIFCLLQYTNAGNCFSEDGSASGNVDVVEIAISANCPHQLIRQWHTQLGRRLCDAVTNDQDAMRAKGRIKQLVPFYRNMPCLLELARSPRFEWTVDDLLELASEYGPRRVIKAIRALADERKSIHGAPCSLAPLPHPISYATDSPRPPIDNI